jgi:hypothetical protein
MDGCLGCIRNCFLCSEPKTFLLGEILWMTMRNWPQIRRFQDRITGENLQIQEVVDEIQTNDADRAFWKDIDWSRNNACLRDRALD